ncbi:hypothetical protein [Acidiphilium sp. AL]|uniref:hypothetical protein n=1 Tax=Acidiphilium sp. AL TaxID=2871704 RepID=UPI0021CB40EF|nr:hypothetical protein [Acidiphilium sp. AL]
MPWAAQIDVGDQCEKIKPDLDRDFFHEPEEFGFALRGSRLIDEQLGSFKT